MTVELEGANHFSSIHLEYGDKSEVVDGNIYRGDKTISYEGTSPRVIFTYKEKLTWIKQPEYDFLQECIKKFKSFDWWYVCGQTNPIDDEIKPSRVFFSDEFAPTVISGYTIIVEGKLK